MYTSLPTLIANAMLENTLIVLIEVIKYVSPCQLGLFWVARRNDCYPPYPDSIPASDMMNSYWVNYCNGFDPWCWMAWALKNILPLHMDWRVRCLLNGKRPFPQNGYIISLYFSNKPSSTSWKQSCVNFNRNMALT